MSEIALPDRRAPVFADNMRLPVHRWFRYSAGFSARWARAVIEEARLQQGARMVLDPFAGSGTTLLAAQEAGVRSIGAEPHPFVHRVAQAKLHWDLDPDTFLASAKNTLKEPSRTKSKASPALLLKCYEPETLTALRAIQRALPRQALPHRELLWLALMAILRPTSHVGTAQWQYILPNKRKARVAAPRDAFLDTCKQFASDIAQRRREISGGGTHAESTVAPWDARDLSRLPAGSIDLVVTSPPYANNYDYADAARLEMTFEGDVRSWSDLAPVRARLMRSCSQHVAGFSIEETLQNDLLTPIRPELAEVVRRLSEAKASHAGKKAYDAMISAYFFDMATVWRELRRVCSDGASVHFVIGDSAPYGVPVPVDRWLGELALASGFRTFQFTKLRDRNDKWKNRKHRVPLHEGILSVKG